MRLASTPRTEFLRSLAGEIMHNYGRGRTIIAIDAADTAERVDFAGHLAEVLEENDRRVFRASMRFFERPQTDQDASEPDRELRRYRSGSDDSALRRVLVEPFRLGGSAGFVLSHRDPDTGAWIQPSWHTAPQDAVLILDGDFMNRPEVHDLWSYSVLLESAQSAQSEQSEQSAELGESAAPSAAAAAYRAEVSPRDVVTAVIDNTDPAAPTRRFLDRC